MAVIRNTQVAAIQRYDYTVAYATQFGTFPNWPQSGGDHLIQVTAEAGSTVVGKAHGHHIIALWLQKKKILLTVKLEWSVLCSFG